MDAMGTACGSAIWGLKRCSESNGGERRACSTITAAAFKMTGQLCAGERALLPSERRVQNAVLCCTRDTGKWVVPFSYSLCFFSSD